MPTVPTNVPLMARPKGTKSAATRGIFKFMGIVLFIIGIPLTLLVPPMGVGSLFLGMLCWRAGKLNIIVGCPYCRANTKWPITSDQRLVVSCPTCQNIYHIQERLN